MDQQEPIDIPAMRIEGQLPDFGNRQMNDFAKMMLQMNVGAVHTMRRETQQLRKDLGEAVVAAKVAVNEDDMVLPAHRGSGTGAALIRYRNDTERSEDSVPRYQPAEVPSEPQHRFETISGKTSLYDPTATEENGVDTYWHDDLWTVVVECSPFTYA